MTDNDKNDSLRRALAAMLHEVRNPLVSIRTLVELLPEHFDDSEFRERLGAVITGDVNRIETIVSRLQQLAEYPSEHSSARPEPVDVSALLERLLEESRETIHSRHLLVLKELDRDQPLALGDPEQLERASRAVLDRALSSVPVRGDLYIASRHQAGEDDDSGTLRVLVRYHHSREGGGAPQAEGAFEYALAAAILKTQGGDLTLDTSDAAETVVLIDLPAPPGR